jgi:hypothetical protein
VPRRLTAETPRGDSETFFVGDCPHLRSCGSKLHLESHGPEYHSRDECDLGSHTRRRVVHLLLAVGANRHASDRMVTI